MGATRAEPAPPSGVHAAVAPSRQRPRDRTVEQVVGLAVASRGTQILTPEAVQRLQASAGNAAVTQLLVGRGGDRRRPEHMPSPAAAPHPLLPRVTAAAHPGRAAAALTTAGRQDGRGREGISSLEDAITPGLAVQRRSCGCGCSGTCAATESEPELTSVQRLVAPTVSVQRGCGCGGRCGGCGPGKEDEPDTVEEGAPVQRLHQCVPAVAPAVSVQRWNPLDWAKKLAQKAIGAIRSLGASAWNTAKSLGTAAWNKAKSAGSSIWNKAKSAGSALGNTVKGLGTSAWNTAKSLGTSVWNTAKSAGASLWNRAKSAGSSVWNTAKGLGSKAWSGAKSVGSKIWNGAKAMGGKAWGAVKGFGAAAVGKVKGLATAAFSHAKNLGGKAWSLAKGVAGKLSLSNLCKAVGALASKAFSAVSSAVKTAWNGAKRWGAKAWNGAKAAGRAIASTATRWAGKAKQFATKAVSGAYRAVKGAASKAWNTAKSLGNKAFTGAKRAATAGWNTAKRLGTKVFTTAKALGGKVLGKAKALGSKIANTAKAAGRKLLGVADKLTGGAASKVAGAAKKVLGKAAGLLSWVVNKAKSLASKAINTAKNLGAKALNAATSAASKAWNTAKQAASKGLQTAKSLGAKALGAAKSLGSKAWSTAKSLGSKAVSTAKSWAGKAWSTAKSWGGKAWGAIKTGAGKVWNTTKTAAGKAWGAAKSLGRGAVKVAKAVGLDTAWNTAKNLGGKALGAIKSGAAALKKRFAPVLDVVGKGAEMLSNAAPAILAGPATLACKVLGCAAPKLVNKGSQTSKEAADFATDVIPGVSTVKDTCRCLTGENIVTGKEEGTGGRIMACIWAAVDIASIIVGIFTAGTGTAAIQAIKAAARAGLRGMIKAIGKRGLRGLVDLAVDLVKRAWKKITGKGPGKVPTRGPGRTPPKKLDGLGETASKPGNKLTPREIDLELDAVGRGRRRPSTVPGYVDEVELPNGHTWRREPAGNWCRFSSTPSVCVPGNKAPQPRPDLRDVPDSIRTRSGVDVKVLRERLDHVLQAHTVEQFNPINRIAELANELPTHITSFFRAGSITNHNELYTLVRQALEGKAGKKIIGGKNNRLQLTIRNQRVDVWVGPSSGGGMKINSIYPTGSERVLTKAEIDNYAQAIQVGTKTLDDVRAELAARFGR